MIQQFIGRIAKALDDRRIPYMIIGGQAVLMHGRPRMTQDVDITLGVDTDQFEPVYACAQALKLRSLRPDPERFAEQTKVLVVQDPESSFRVDFLFSNTPYEREAIRRSVKIEVDGYPARFASPEDLIIHKIFAGRAIDHEDAQAVLLRKGADLDRAYIQKWLRSLGEVSESGEDLLSVWNRLCKGATHPKGSV